MKKVFDNFQCSYIKNDLVFNNNINSNDFLRKCKIRENTHNYGFRVIKQFLINGEQSINNEM